MNDKKLSDSEREIMEIIWKKSIPCCVQDIFSELENKERKYTTIATFLSRLVKKGFLKQEKKGVQNFYKAKLGKEDYLKKETNNFVKELYSGKAEELIACLCKDKISKENYNELLKLLEKYSEN